MATSNTITREVVSTSEQATANFNGWTLNYTIQKNGEVVQNVNVHGNKEQGNVSGYVSDNGSFSITFGSGDPDNVLAAALFDDLKSIRGTVAPTT